MTTQEKAAAYDMAIERTRRMIEDYKNRGLDNYYACAKESLEKIFPELAESDDERIRKWLIYYLHKQRGLLTEENHDEYNQKILNAVAWLEKQGEQKPANWLQELEDKLANATPKQLAEWKEKYFKEEPAKWRLFTKVTKTNSRLAQIPQKQNTSRAKAEVE